MVPVLHLALLQDAAVILAMVGAIQLHVPQNLPA